MHSHYGPFRLSTGVFSCRLSKIAQKLCFASFVTTQPDRDHCLLGRRGRMRKPICKSAMPCIHFQHHCRSKPIIFGQWAARRFWVYRQFPNLTQITSHGLVLYMLPINTFTLHTFNWLTKAFCRTTTRCRTIHYQKRKFRPVFWLFIGETHSFRMWLCTSTDSSVTLHRRQQMKFIFRRIGNGKCLCPWHRVFCLV